MTNPNPRTEAGFDGVGLLPVEQTDREAAAAYLTRSRAAWTPREIARIIAGDGDDMIIVQAFAARHRLLTRAHQPSPAAVDEGWRPIRRQSREAWQAICTASETEKLQSSAMDLLEALDLVALPAPPLLTPGSGEGE